MKIKVGVFFGGISVEHEVSVISALQAVASMDKEKYDIIPVYIAKDGFMYSGDELLSMENFKKGIEPNEAYEKAKGTYGRFADAAKYIDPRKE